MTDKAIELAEIVWYVAHNPQLYSYTEAVDAIADLIRPHLAPEYKYAQVPCSEYISADGFTEDKLQPKKDTDMEVLLEWVDQTPKGIHLYDDLKTLAAAYRELSAKYDKLMEIAMEMLEELKK
jgi:hypothetical protein